MDNSEVLYDLLKSLDGKQDVQLEKLVKLEVEVSKNSADLEHHIKRTDLLEEQLKLQKKAVNERFKKIEEPRTTIKSVGKFLVWAGSIGAGLYGIYRGVLAIKHLF